MELSAYEFNSMTSLVLVGFFWGVTNPFLKKGTKGLDKLTERNIVKKIFKEIIFLITNWKYTVPFIINQCGSIIFYFTLRNTDLTIAVPVSNSLSFVFNALAGWLVGEENPDRLTLLGMILVALGISCYLFV